MDVVNVQVMRNQHPEPLWDHYHGSVGTKEEPQPKEWLEKAKTKHKVLALRDIWSGESTPARLRLLLIVQELNSEPPQSSAPAFTYQELEQQLRELDAPLDSFVTL
jgi:hypothetical protein